jgi:hypothetical protein
MKWNWRTTVIEPVVSRSLEMLALCRAGVGMKRLNNPSGYRFVRIKTFLFIGMALLSAALFADTVNLPAEKDNTLYAEGDLSNGAGDHLFTGSTNAPSIRRAVIKFDIDGAIPAGATIDSVQLTLNASRNNNATSEDTSLHRLTSDWGESGSNASGNEGGGATAENGDATWEHTFFPGSFWSTSGGDFIASASASIPVDVTGGHVWGSTASMVADVQQWLDQPASNFGWIIIGNESQSATSKRFDSREILDGNAPGLEVMFTPAPPPEGSCCTGFSCQVVTEAECTVLKGSYGGNDTTCEPNPCDPAGACCASNGDCTDTTLSLCLDGDGFFQSPSSSCGQILECPVFKDGFESNALFFLSVPKSPTN